MAETNPNDNSPKSLPLRRHSDVLVNTGTTYSATTPNSLNEGNSISSHRELIIPSSAGGRQQSPVLDLVHPISSGNLTTTSQETRTRNCISWCSGLFNFRNSSQQTAENLSLLPVYHVRSNTSPTDSAGMTSNLSDFIRRLLPGLARDRYPNTFSWLLATLLTIVLIAATLGLYFSGNLLGLLVLFRALVCSVFRQLQPSDVALPLFCRS